MGARGRANERYPPTRVFLQKSAYFFDGKGLGFFEGTKERATVRN